MYHCCCFLEALRSLLDDLKLRQRYLIQHLVNFLEVRLVQVHAAHVRADEADFLAVRRERIMIWSAAEAVIPSLSVLWLPMAAVEKPASFDVVEYEHALELEPAHDVETVAAASV